MNEIKCPKCGEVFTIDEQAYDSIVKQVRDSEFEKEVLTRIDLSLIAKSKELEAEKLKSDAEFKGTISELNAELVRLKEQISAKDNEKELAVNAAVAEKDSELAGLRSELKNKDKEKELAISTAISEKVTEINNQKEEIQKLNSALEKGALEAKLQLENQKSEYETRLKFKDEEIERYKDFKVRLSTKMIGESLEQHCQNEFNKIRSAAFPRAEFGKDNDARTGSKGDFIFRDYDEYGNEIVSVMLEMKNEADGTSKKHKNEDFFKELDKDRKQKNCEYAILVSMLEPESELYNTGIVDVSYEYEKMFVIRPQYMILLLSLLRDAGMKASNAKHELEKARNMNLDIENFEAEMKDFKARFSYNYRLASEKFNAAVEDINKTIKQLEKIRDELTSSERNLRIANDKANALTIKSLTKNSPVLRAKFEEISKGESIE